MGKIILFGTGDIAQLAHYYFSLDKEYEIAAFTVDKEFIKENKTDEELQRLTELDETLGRLDFSKAARDPRYLEFIKAIKDYLRKIYLD